MLPKFFYRKTKTSSELLKKKLENDNFADTVSQTDEPMGISISTIIDMIVFGCGLSTVAFFLGYFYGYSNDDKAVMYTLLTSILIAMLAGIGIKFDTKIFTLGTSESKIKYEDLRGYLVGIYMIALVSCLYLGFEKSHFPNNNDFAMGRRLKDLPFRIDSLKLDFATTKNWLGLIKTLREEGYNEVSLENLTCMFLAEYNTIDSLKKKIMALEGR